MALGEEKGTLRGQGREASLLPAGQALFGVVLEEPYLQNVMVDEKALFPFTFSTFWNRHLHLGVSSLPCPTRNLGFPGGSQ